MPYIRQAVRPSVDCVIDQLNVNDPGVLNYAITRLVHKYMGRNPDYAAYNEAVGVLECAKLELYRRHVVPYEDRKIAENGDVP